MTASHLDVRLLEQARKEINELIVSRTEAITAGIAADYADYRFRCGEIAGFDASLRIMTEIVKRMGDSRSS